MLAQAGDASKLSAVVWLYLICVVLPAEFFIGSVALTPLRIFLLFMVIPLSINLFAGRYGKLLAPDYLYFAFILWATLAVAINNPNRVVENVGSAAVEFLGGYLIARAYIRTPNQFESLIKIVLLLIALSLPLSVVEALSGHAVIPTLIEKIPGVTSVTQWVIPKRLGLFRVQNVFAHPIHYGLFCSVAFSLVLVGFHDRVSLFNRLLACGVIFAGVFLSLSSGAVLAVLLQIGLISWAIVLRNYKRKWLILLGLFALAYVVVDLLSNRTPVRVLMTYATFSSQTAYYRANIFEWGMKNVWDNPIFGLGLRTWIRPAYMDKGSVDNFWLLMAMKYGIPGFLLMLAGYFSGLFKVGLHNLSFSPRVSLLRLAWMFTFCGLSFTLVTVHVWTSMYSFVFFIFGAGLWMVYYSPADEGSLAQDAPAAISPGRELRYSRQTKPGPASPAVTGQTYSRSVPTAKGKPQIARETQNPPRRYSRYESESAQDSDEARQTKARSLRKPIGS